VEDLRKTLNALPKSLDITYQQILLDIDELHRDDAYKILQWLAFSARPVTLTEVAEALTVDLDNDCLLGPNQQLGDPYDILTICSTLVTISKPSPSSDADIVEDAGVFNM
jgi:hypothetical protein